MKSVVSPRRQKKVADAQSIEIASHLAENIKPLEQVIAANGSDIKQRLDNLLEITQSLKLELDSLQKEQDILKKMSSDLNETVIQNNENYFVFTKRIINDILHSREVFAELIESEISQPVLRLEGFVKKNQISLQSLSKEIVDNRAVMVEDLKKDTQYLLQKIIQVMEDKNTNLSTSILQVLNEITLHRREVAGLFKQELTQFVGKFEDGKEERDLERTISFQIGKTLIDSKKSLESLVSLPNRILQLKNEAKLRAKKLNNVSVSDNKVIDTPIITVNTNGENKLIQPKVQSLAKEINVEKDYPLISYDFIKKQWPKAVSKSRFLSILDEISENSWCNEFKLYPVNKNNYVEQIQKSTSNALFIESCWKGNSGSWEYAFTSPGLQHANAQKLLDALSIAKNRNLPIIFWNKEDPMHYEKFLPIAERCDIIFTTDENRVPDYKRDLPGKKVFSLVFAANPFICNPINRNRYEQETICFAGSYYSVGHDDRKVQMDQLLPALLEFNGAIYDRMSKLNNERYYFPEQYRHLIRDAVDFKTMSVLYKRFKIFLNVNTITDSPTMMSRRVYELLACGTPVISTPSLALETQFPGIVQIAKNAEEAVNIAKELLQDEWKYKHLAHRGYREVMLKHTYSSRVKQILASIDIEYDDSPAKVSILMATMRENYIDRILDNLGRQNYSNLELFVVTQGFSVNGIKRLKDGIEKISNIHRFEIIEINDNTVTLGERLNKAASFATGEYLAKMDDDDFYFENYLTDMIIPFSYGNFGLVGKKEIFIYLEGSNKTIIRYKDQSHRVTDFVFGATLVIKKQVFDQIGGFTPVNQGEDSSILARLKELKISIYSSDAFNFIAFRSKEREHHTWQTDDDFFLKNAEIFDDFDVKKVVI
ncbi:glycosyltransferase family protein [Acinetobacter equi]|uniref:Glycosyltransferase 2-like domain-containing protein n=1 Tax=Acinetobacter equi TaxID=1324350 RepID=A0A0N9W0Z8_9GAMM|nr:glycosyltransferase [Acinetobacter equi]ALH94689.1 hypothetical protein AOY20_03600 [Acinetobacter equi]